MNKPGGNIQLVEVKNGKILFKQKAIQFDKLSETLQEIVRFREMLTRYHDPITHIPAEHHSLIGKLAHESDKTLHMLSKSIRSQLLPEPIEVETGEGTGSRSFENLLPVIAIEAVLQSVAERVNYGLEQGQYGLSKPSAALCLWRWEIKDPSILPSQFRDKAEKRKAERLAARMEIRSILDPLTPEMRAPLLGIKNNLKLKEARSAEPSTGSAAVRPPEMGENVALTASSQASGSAGKVGDDNKDAPKPPAKVQKLQQEEAATKKSAAAFAKFFNKNPTPKTEILTVKYNKDLSAQGSSARSDFERAFHPFVPKKNVVMAPSNWFSVRKKDVIIIDSDEDLGGPSSSARALLEKNIKSLPPGLTNRQPTKSSWQYKSRAPDIVRDIMDRLADAEVCGDEAKVLLLTNQLNDRRRIPVKTLTFAEDSRPGYTGTWTRSSTTVGPRTPLTRDLVTLDYNCDSGEEWEVEPEGDEVLSGSDSGDDGSDEDSLDGWLIDDDEDVGGEPINLDHMDVDGYELPSRKRKTAHEPQKNKDKKRKLAQPLVPFSKGPYWEVPAEQCSQWEGLAPYRIQFFNDCEGPVNPFTYTPRGVEAKPSPYRARSGNIQVSGPENSFPGQGKMNEIQWKVPTQTASARLPAFPDEHIRALLQGIQRCKTASLNVLVDTLYQELKQVKVKKNSIERKVREIAEKRLDSDAGTKIWTLKLEYLQSGLSIA